MRTIVNYLLALRIFRYFRDGGIPGREAGMNWWRLYDIGIFVIAISISLLYFRYSTKPDGSRSTSTIMWLLFFFVTFLPTSYTFRFFRDVRLPARALGMKWWLICGIGMFAVGMSFTWILTYFATTSDASRGTPTTVFFLTFVVMLPVLVVLAYRSIQAALAPVGLSAYQRSLPLLAIISLFVIGALGCALAIMGFSEVL